MVDIFISYARADRSKIEKLAAALEAEGYSVWWDRRVVGGSEFSKEIERELDAAKAVIVCWSAKANESAWVKDEASAAREQTKLIPILLDASRAPMGFRQYQAIPFEHWSGATASSIFEDLNRAIEAQLSGRAPSITPKQFSIRQDAINWLNRHRMGVIAAISVFFILLAGVYSISMGEIEKESGRAAVQDDRKLVAVLPFKSSTGEDDEALYAAGVHEDIIIKLTKVAGIDVIASRSVIEVSRKADTLSEIADILGANIILDGSVEHSGERLRISLQLIDVKNNTQLWGEVYDQNLTARNLFDVEEQIAVAVASALDANVSNEELRQIGLKQTNDLDAYKAYTQGINFMMYPQSDLRAGLDAAYSAFERAVELDREYAAAYAGMAQVNLSRYQGFRNNPTERSQWLLAARASIETATFLAPKSLETLFATGYFHLWGDLNYEKAEAFFDKAIEVAPNFASAYSAKGYAARRSGRFQEALLAIEKAVRLNPLEYSALVDLSRTYSLYGRFEEAWYMYERAASLNNNPISDMIARSWLWEAEGKAENAYAEFKPIRVDEANSGYYFFQLHHALNTRDADKIKHALNVWPEGMRSGGPFPETYAILKIKGLQIIGENDQAAEEFAALEKSYVRARGGMRGAWPSFAPYYPVTIPALLGDSASVKREIDAYHENFNGDQWQASVFHDRAIADALAIVGDSEGAFDYLENYIREFGPAGYLVLSVDPDLYVLHGQPRWDAMKSQYESWATAQEKGV